MKFVVLLLLVGLAACDAQNFHFGNRDRSRSRSRDRFRGRPNQFFSPASHTSPTFGGFEPTQIQFPEDNRGPSGKAHDSDGVYEYNFSWREGKKKLTGGGARNYCSNLGSGWAPVSIESPAKNEYVKRLIRRDNLKYIWTGATKSSRGFVWPNGRSLQFSDWSRTGGKNIPQPDNREQNENCLAVLDNVYRDGIKWHDVGCGHEKPTVCERRL